MTLYQQCFQVTNNQSAYCRFSKVYLLFRTEVLSKPSAWGSQDEYFNLQNQEGRKAGMMLITSQAWHQCLIYYYMIS
jgi:hypothetical protein